MTIDENRNTSIGYIFANQAVVALPIVVGLALILEFWEWVPQLDPSPAWSGRFAMNVLRVFVLVVGSRLIEFAWNRWRRRWSVVHQGNADGSVASLRVSRGAQDQIALMFHLRRNDGGVARLGVFHSGGIPQGDFVMSFNTDQARQLSELIDKATRDV